ncbi:MAG TPA: hypothetical protein VID07_03510, partial [Actinomycetes bacterium]
MVALLAFALLVAHTPMVRARALVWVIGQLETRYGLVLSAERLSYNLVTGTAGLDGVRLAARNGYGQPFFTARRVHVNLPIAAYLGTFTLGEIAVEGGQVTLHRSADGVSNLPTPSAPATVSSSRTVLPIQGLRLTGLSVHYTDET